MAGWHNGLFYLRDYNDNFRLHINGRAQIDFFSYAGAGVGDTALKPTLFFRRIRPEVSGEILKHWSFMIAGDFGATALDNPRGTNETSAAAPGAAPTATSGRYASAETTKFQAAPADVFMNYSADPRFNVQVGQFDSNFMMENRTTDKYTPYMERSLAVRAVGEPFNKEIGAMLWGAPENRFWYYSVALYNGDGQNRLNPDSRGDVFVRGYVRPLTTSVQGPLKDLQVGGSFRYGSRDKNYVYWDYPALTTQGNYTFWNTTYTGANGPTHIIPSGDQIGAAGELRIPISMFDLMGEFLYVRNNTREAIEGFQATNSERFGNIHGIAYYASLGFWVFGKRDINGIPGDEYPPHVNFDKPDPPIPATALQLLAKWEQVSLTYLSSSRAGQPDAKNIDGDIKVNAVEFGVNYWATKHVRLTLNLIQNIFPDSAPNKATAPGAPVQTTANRALAPGNTLAPGVNDTARDNAHSLTEILMRFAIAL